MQLSNQEQGTGSTKIDISPNLETLAGAYLDTGNTSGASQVLCDALVVMQPKGSNGLPRLISTYELMRTSVKTGRFDDIRHFLTTAISTETKRSGADSIAVNEYRVQLAEVLLKSAQGLSADADKEALLEESERTFDTAAESYLKVEGPATGRLASAVRRRALIFTICGLAKEASQLQEKYKQQKVNRDPGSTLLMN